LGEKKRARPPGSGFMGGEAREKGPKAEIQVTAFAGSRGA